MNSCICKFCSYKWQQRINSPKSCPRCKRRFDYYEVKEKIINLKEMLLEIELDENR